MPQVSYVLREDPHSIFLLQDAGRIYDRYCQISIFTKYIVKPKYFRRFLYIAPNSSNNGKYQGNPTRIQMSIEDNGYIPSLKYVAVIDSEVEFRITPAIIRKLSIDHMPAWGMKSYLDYYGNHRSGILLFLRLYKVKQEINPFYLEKGEHGKYQIFKIYNEQGNETTIPIDLVEPVISDNKFSYIKDEILHLLKVENSLIALYDNTEKGLNSLQERVIADKHIEGTKERFKNSHLHLQLQDYDEDDDFDMAQLDYEAIYREILDISPSMKPIIDYVRGIQAARLGEYDYYLKEVHNHTPNEKKSVIRLFEMSLRVAVKNALYYHKKYNFDIEDVFQEACIGIINAINKHNDNVAGLFPSYVSMYIRHQITREYSPYEYNFRIPVHYRERIEKIVKQITNGQNISYSRDIDINELYNLIKNKSNCKEKEAFRLFYIITYPESIEKIINDHQKEELLIENRNILDEIISNDFSLLIREALNTLTPRQLIVIKHRLGFDGNSPLTLEEVGSIMGITRERVRQIESVAKYKLIPFISSAYYDE